MHTQGARPEQNLFPQLGTRVPRAVGYSFSLITPVRSALECLMLGKELTESGFGRWHWYRRPLIPQGRVGSLRVSV
jgi:hypothetical protein